MRHERHENGVHAVVTEPLRRLVAHDERHARRHFIRLYRRGAVLKVGHKVARTVSDSQWASQRENRRLHLFPSPAGGFGLLDSISITGAEKGQAPGIAAPPW